MELLNDMTTFKPQTNEDFFLFREIVNGYLILLNPIAPHITEELNSILENKKMIVDGSWIEYRDEYCTDNSFELVFQVNGKIRGRADADINISEEDAKNMALENDKVQEFIAGKNIVKVVYVKQKLVNIVVK